MNIKDVTFDKGKCYALRTFPLFAVKIILEIVLWKIRSKVIAL
jgi:hypothetical protein